MLYHDLVRARSRNFLLGYDLVDFDLARTTLCSSTTFRARAQTRSCSSTKFVLEHKIFVLEQKNKVSTPLVHHKFLRFSCWCSTARGWGDRYTGMRLPRHRKNVMQRNCEGGLPRWRVSTRKCKQVSLGVVFSRFITSICFFFKNRGMLCWEEMIILSEKPGFECKHLQTHAWRPAQVEFSSYKSVQHRYFAMIFVSKR